MFTDLAVVVDILDDDSVRVATSFVRADWGSCSDGDPPLEGMLNMHKNLSASADYCIENVFEFCSYPML